MLFLLLIIYTFTFYNEFQSRYKILSLLLMLNVPGSNEVPSEDALVLQIHLAKGQEKLVGELRAQQAEVRHLQNGLKDQQDILLAQQKEILEQQRRIFEQMEQVKVQYRLVTDNFRNVAQYKDLEGHLDTLRSEIRTHTQEAYTIPKVDMEESVMEVGRQIPGCSSCQADEYCDFTGDWPKCEKCTVCLPGFFLVSQCSIHTDRMCQVLTFTALLLKFLSLSGASLDNCTCLTGPR